MKLVLEVANNSYQTILDFISLLPENQCQVLPEETAAFHLPEIMNQKHFKFASEQTQLVLPVDTKLMLALTIHNKPELNESLKKHLKLRNTITLGFDCFATKWSVDTQFVEITVVEPTKKQKN